MKALPQLALVVYLLVIAFFAFRPFKPIPGLTYPAVPPSTNGVLRTGAALEDEPGSRRLWNALTQRDRMTLVARLKTDSLDQGGQARIISFSNHAMSRNFTLGQEGNGLFFRLRTSKTDANGMYPSLTVPKVFKEGAFQHIAITYNGSRVGLHVDGVPHAEAIQLTGDFSTWGKNHLLTAGDEPGGVRPWHGQIDHFFIYDRALVQTEIESLHAGKHIPGAIYAFPEPDAMRPLRHRNLFVTADFIFNARDCVANIIAFLPLAPLMWLVIGNRFRKPIVFYVSVAALGFLISGLIEFLQRGIDGRVPCLADLAYNVLGTVVGCLLLWFGLKHRWVSAMVHTR